MIFYNWPCTEKTYSNNFTWTYQIFIKQGRYLQSNYCSLWLNMWNLQSADMKLQIVITRLRCFSQIERYFLRGAPRVLSEKKNRFRWSIPKAKNLTGFWSGKQNGQIVKMHDWLLCDSWNVAKLIISPEC